ncbi:MAG: 23S rRNA (uracil(1939)-C(5))-methyltransferase RlmD [Lachnospiraceae bacterium]|nr:23S rRNA (uracil(1939)-C(5))-methyltransferase RlmD [Lachnospiraceae bacterium]
MKKGMILEGKVIKMDFPNKGTVEVAGEEGTERVSVKNALPGQTVSFVINKTRGGRYEGRLLEVVRKADCETAGCSNAGICGGCLYQGFPYEETLKIKEEQIKGMLEEYTKEAEYDGILPSPEHSGYRNKMEYTFGDEEKGGALKLGLHRRGSFYDIVNAGSCIIADSDFGMIVDATERYFAERKIPYYHRQSHEGILRHLLVRKAANTGELLAALVTTGDECGGPDSVGENRAARKLLTDGILEGWKEEILKLELKGHVRGLLHIENNVLGDVVRCDRQHVLYGEDHFEEELLGLKFKISPFSFFQTNSHGAEVLYGLVRKYISAECEGAEIYDLYSGTGTIAQLAAAAAAHVTGVEIVEEAVEAAKENAAFNGLTNCDFIAGDVLKVLDDIEEKPDVIILDPPRDGIHPKALKKILDYGVKKMVYVSCKPTSLKRDMEEIAGAGYGIKRWGMVDMFPFTGNCETVCLLSRPSGAKHDMTDSKS